MSVESTRIAVETLFQAGMTTLFPLVPLIFPNADDNTPAGMHASIYLLEGRGHEANIGNRTVDRHVGIVQVTIACPVRSGTSQGNAVADGVGNMFRNKQLPLIDGALLRFRIPSFSFVADVAGYAHILVRIPYWRDELPR